MAKAKAKEAAEAADSEVLEGPEASEAEQPTRVNPPGWGSQKTRASIRHATGAVKGSDVTPPRPEYKPKKSSDSYLAVTFGQIDENEHGRAFEAARLNLDTIKESWKQVDEAKGPILANDMESPARRLDQLDKYAEERRKQAEQAVTSALEVVDEEIEVSHELTKHDLKPKPDEVLLIATWQATLATKGPDELREIVRGAISDRDMLVLKAAFGSREWMIPMGASRTELLRQFENEIGGGRADLRDRLKKLRDRIENTRKVAKEHFDGVLDNQQKADLRRARERQAAAQKVT